MAALALQRPGGGAQPWTRHLAAKWVKYEAIWRAFTVEVGGWSRCFAACRPPPTR
jgi:hypothetical protein